MRTLFACVSAYVFARTCVRNVSRRSVLTRPPVVGLWIRHLGYANYVEKFVKHQIWPQLLLVLKEEDLRLIGVKPSDVPVLWELIRSYQQFSSVEGTGYYHLVAVDRKIAHTDLISPM